MNIADLARIDFSDVADVTQPRTGPVHPGIILLEDWLKPLGLSQYALAKAIDVPARRINEIVHGQRGITVDTAFRLAKYFDTSAQFWMHLQTHYDIETARATMTAVLDRISRCERLAPHA